MEIDSARLQGINPQKETENARLRKEGRCYKCGEIGHLKKECPKWQSTSVKPPPYSKARSTNLKTIEETVEEDQPQDLKELARSMTTLNDDKKDELFNLLLEGEQDF
jgi:hypothetical protein